jgi:tRNA A-37 threonylcarbamoyl transferase component Bud32
VLGGLLGRGGMAEVFGGSSLGSHGFAKPVAIKRLLPEHANDHVYVARLIGEAKLVVGMQHGNIVSVLDLAREGDDVFLVMEYVDGPSLRQLLKARGEEGLPVGVATYIVQAAAAGLEFAHARPGGAVIHADVSPSNLLLTTSGEVRVADFGIARRAGKRAGIIEGKWAYMAPEQVRGDALTPQADVFALGIVLYELITGQHPLGRQITADTRESRPLRVIPPRVVKPSLPLDLDAICMRALAVDPRDRFARMQDLIVALGDARFAHGWRDSASELAAAIKGLAPGALAIPVAAERGPTLSTCSLIAAPIATPIAAPSLPVVPRGSASIEVPVVVTGSPPMQPAVDPDYTDARHGRRWPVAVLGLAALVGAIAALAIQLAPDARAATAQGATETRVTASAGMESAPVPAPIAATPIAPAPVAPAPVAPAPGPAEVTVQPIAVLAPKPTEVRHPSHAVVVKKPGGTLIVTSEPWAYVTVDASLEGETPTQRFANLPAGAHRVRLKNGVTGAVIARDVVVPASGVALLRIRQEEWP